MGDDEREPGRDRSRSPERQEGAGEDDAPKRRSRFSATAAIPAPVLEAPAATIDSSALQNAIQMAQARAAAMTSGTALGGLPAYAASPLTSAPSPYAPSVGLTSLGGPPQRGPPPGEPPAPPGKKMGTVKSFNMERGF
eukprot:6773931-Prymnesium_polylepis.1